MQIKMINKKGDKMEIDEEIKAKLESLSTTIVSALKEKGNIFINI